MVNGGLTALRCIVHVLWDRIFSYFLGSMVFRLGVTVRNRILIYSILKPDLNSITSF